MPEIRLRQALHRAGLRFRLHDAKLPGRPDIKLPSRQAVILVHGCFWHRHPGCHWCTTPATNAEFWQRKFTRNVERDAKALETLVALGWRTGVVWECGLRRPYISETVANVVEWLRSDAATFESSLVRTVVS